MDEGALIELQKPPKTLKGTETDVVEMNGKERPLEHEELTGTIRQTAFEVHNYFRNGFLEKVYENTLAHRLRKKWHTVNQRIDIDVCDEDGTVVGRYEADLIVDNLVLIEVKAIRALGSEESAQLLNYLKATNFRLGLLINLRRQEA